MLERKSHQFGEAVTIIAPLDIGGFVQRSAAIGSECDYYVSPVTMPNDDIGPRITAPTAMSAQDTLVEEQQSFSRQFNTNRNVEFFLKRDAVTGATYDTGFD